MKNGDEFGVGENQNKKEEKRKKWKRKKNEARR